MLTETVTTTQLTTEEAVVAGGILGGMLATVGIMAFVFYLFMVIATWKIFVKAGEKGWKSLIPIYNVYMLYKIVGMKNWFWGLLGFSIVEVVLLAVCCPAVFNAQTEAEIQAIDWGKNWVALVLFGVEIILAIVASILYAKRTAKAFGKGAGFAVGLFFLPSIFWLILGFGSAKYSKKALKD